MDYSSRAGLFGSAFAVGRSYQPNLLTRGSVDQSIVTGTTAAAAYGVMSAGSSALSAIASRISRSETPSIGARLLVASTVASGAAGASVALSWREHESSHRAIGRLAAHTALATVAANVAALATPGQRGRRDTGLVLGTAAAIAVASWASTRPWKSAPGSLLTENMAGATTKGSQSFFEDSVREVSPAKSVAIGAVVGLATYGLAKAESALTSATSRAATAVIGGEPQDHRMIGRVTSAALTLGFGWFAVAKVSTLLSKGGGSLDAALVTAPTTPEVTGSPASGLDWLKQTREGARWLSMALPPESIAAVMGVETAKQPIRVYASLEIAPSDEERARVLLAEIDRTKALERKAFALFSPTGSGYVNYVATESFEYLTLGDCASAAIQYSVLPSALSLTRVPTGSAQTAMVISGIVQRLMAMPKAKRPNFYLFGESLGSQVSEEMFKDTGMLGLEGTGIHAALWIGTPAATVWRRQIWGKRTITETPAVGPDAAYLPRSIVDWRALSTQERSKVRYLLLQNGDDPIPKFGSQVVWRRPDWLGPNATRPIGAPKGTQWMPVTTFMMTFLDMLNALTPTPGIFAEGG
ncbi:MAG: hypothetical protein F2836_04630, partial [Actinobacteria bacterium]|nr:hypothetical protein [Actinomycetota bacterium]